MEPMATKAEYRAIVDNVSAILKSDINLTITARMFELARSGGQGDRIKFDDLSKKHPGARAQFNDIVNHEDSSKQMDEFNKKLSAMCDAMDEVMRGLTADEQARLDEISKLFAMEASSPESLSSDVRDKLDAYRRRCQATDPTYDPYDDYVQGPGRSRAQHAKQSPSTKSAE